MKFTLETAGGANLVRGWETGRLRVNQTDHTTSVVVAADAVIALELDAATPIDESALGPALALGPEILIVGTGSVGRPLAPAVVAALARRRIGVEVMDTVAAARTYNVLVGEGRRVVAVLIPPGE